MASGQGGRETKKERVGGGIWTGGRETKKERVGGGIYLII